MPGPESVACAEENKMRNVTYFLSAQEVVDI